MKPSAGQSIEILVENPDHELGQALTGSLFTS